MVEGMDTGSTRSLGIRLTPDDVADGIWDATTHRGRLPKVHYRIGIQAKMLSGAAKLSPAWALRTANRLITRS